MSSLIVRVNEITAVETHPNADNLEIVVVKGWRCCTGKGNFKAGDKVVYFPPDTVLPRALSDRLGVTNYLTPLPAGPDGVVPAAGRVKVASLRGQKSYGFCAPCDDPTWPLDMDLAEHYGLSKYEPPEPCTDGDSEKPHPSFVKYTNIENYRNFPNVIKDGEEVVFTEKIHGKNTRLALLRIADENGKECFTFAAGSHDVRRKEFIDFTKPLKDENGEVLKDEEGNPKTKAIRRRSDFWDCFTPNLRALMYCLAHKNGPFTVKMLETTVKCDLAETIIRDENLAKEVLIFGEMYGQGVQDMAYNTKFGFRVFDIMVNGKYLDHDVKTALLEEFSVERVPLLYKGPFTAAKMEEFVDGPTTLCPADKAGAFKGREGIVITPVKERYDYALGGDGRVILKAVSFAYLSRKKGTEYH